MFDLIAQVLAWFYELPVVGGSYGLAIIMLTISVMILLMPLTLRATRSTIKMQRLQPEMKRVQKEYKDDREAMNRELMALYSEHGINPVGGCIPMIAQLPVFLVLFQVLRGLTRRLSERPFFEAANQLRASSNLETLNAEAFDPKFVSTDSLLYQDLAETDEMSFGPFDLAVQAGDLVQSNFLRSIPYLILIAFVVASSYYQQRQVSARRGTDQSNSPMNQQQQILLKVLPLMTGIWSFFFPAGLVVYWATSNLFRIGQQSYITRQIYEREGAAEELAESRRQAEIAEKKSKKKAAASGDATSSDANGSDKSKGSASNGSKAEKVKDPQNMSKAEKREADWEARRKVASAKKSTKKSATPSSRVTPKGTAPNRSKKKKK